MLCAALLLACTDRPTLGDTTGDTGHAASSSLPTTDGPPTTEPPPDTTTGAETHALSGATGSTDGDATTEDTCGFICGTTGAPPSQ